MNDNTTQKQIDQIKAQEAGQVSVSEEQSAAVHPINLSLNGIDIPNGNMAFNEPTALEKLMQAAMAPDFDVAKLEKLLAMHEKLIAKQEKSAFIQALAGFKAEAPTLKKDKSVGYDSKDGTQAIGYKHSSLGYAISEVTPALSKFGLSLTWDTRQEGAFIHVTANLTHEAGHREQVTMSGNPDGTGKKNPIQQLGSTVTYLQRYTAFSILGLASIDDDDAQAVGGVEAITQEEAGKLVAQMQAAGENYNWIWGLIMTKYQIQDIAFLPAGKFAEVTEEIKAALEKRIANQGA